MAACGATSRPWTSWWRRENAIRQAAGAGRFRARQWPRSGEKCRAVAPFTTSETIVRSSFRLVELLEKAFGRNAETELVPMQPGDVPETYADVADLMREVGFRPSTPIEEASTGSSAGFATITSI